MKITYFFNKEKDDSVANGIGDNKKTFATLRTKRKLS